MGGSGRGAVPSCIECEHARPRSCTFLNVQGDPTYPHGVKTHRVLHWAANISEAQPPFQIQGCLGVLWAGVGGYMGDSVGTTSSLFPGLCLPWAGWPALRGVLAFLPLSLASFFSAESISQSLNTTCLVLIIQWDH